MSFKILEKLPFNLFSRCTKQLVVARYREPIYNWVLLVPADVSVKVYLKYGDVEDLTAGVLDLVDEVEPLANIGREGHTYLHHIIQNYDNLCEYTIFTQADPFKHNPTFVQDLFDNMDKGEVFRSFGKWWQKEYPPDNIIEGGIRPNIHIGNRDFVCIHPTFWEDDGWVRIVRRIKMRNHIDYIIPWVCRRLDLVEPTTGVPISMCGMFGVHRSKIQMYSKSFYEKMRDFLLEHPDHGYVIERFWATLFLLGCAQTE